jgi:hypothetical protein
VGVVAAGPAASSVVGRISVGGYLMAAWWRVAVAEGCVVASSDDPSRNMFAVV